MKTDNTAELIELLFKISRLMKGEMSYTNNLTHLSVLQIQALIFIKLNPSTSMSDIAQNFRIELPSATSLINKLCRQKLVSRHQDTHDRRLVMLTLTDDGLLLLEQAVRERKIKLEKILSYLSSEEKSSLLTILSTLNTRLQK